MNRNIIGKMTDAMKISKNDTVLVNCEISHGLCKYR